MHAARFLLALQCSTSWLLATAYCSQLDVVPIEWAMLPAGLLTRTQAGDQEWKVALAIFLQRSMEGLVCVLLRSC